jgi:hypothetical protein
MKTHEVISKIKEIMTSGEDTSVRFMWLQCKVLDSGFGLQR